MDLVARNFAPYRLIVEGAVERPQAFSLAQLQRMPRWRLALNPSVPFVALIFPVTTVSAGDGRKAANDFDSPYPLCALVT